MVNTFWACTPIFLYTCLIGVRPYLQALCGHWNTQLPCTYTPLKHRCSLKKSDHVQKAHLPYHTHYCISEARYMDHIVFGCIFTAQCKRCSIYGQQWAKYKWKPILHHIWKATPSQWTLHNIRASNPRVWSPWCHGKGMSNTLKSGWGQKRSQVSVILIVLWRDYGYLEL